MKFKTLDKTSMKMNNTSDSKSTSDDLIDLYTRIPDYSEVQHLGQSDFINTLEKLKEEFRQCRASLYNEEFCSDSEYLVGGKTTNNRSQTYDNIYSSKYCTKSSNENKLQAASSSATFDDLPFHGHEKVTKINNHNLTSFHDNSQATVDICTQNERHFTAGSDGNDGQYLSIKSCELHRTPYKSTSSLSFRPSRYISERSLFGGYNTDGEKKNSGLLDDDFDDSDEDDEFDYGKNQDYRNEDRWSIMSSNSDISLSKWSSSPDIYMPRSKSKEYIPPANTEQRLLIRKSQNNSAPSVAFKDESEEIPKPTFKANPVPNHVYKPLYEFIMLKNQRRSDRVREQSRRRLLAQVKPFSFYKDPKSPYSHHGKSERSGESLNNTKPLKKRRNDTLGNIKTNNNRLNLAAGLFKAKPAPPRTKALLAAIRQREQQEYRELKKQLRAEVLLKNASLPPSMAAREKRTKLAHAKIDEVLLDFQKLNKKKGRNYRETSTGTEDTGVLTDDDRMTDDEYTTRRITTVVKPFKFSQRAPKRFTSFGDSRHSAAATGVFEASSNDNHASRLRYQASKLKESDRIKRDEEEMLRIMRAEKRRQKLRDAHLYAWQHACSYSAEQDIAMRRQLRHAASILERDTYVRDMSCMLSRVRSAPLLLEGGHRLERKKEPCKKHREEFTKPNSSTDRPWNKLSTPRLYSSKNWIPSKTVSMLDRFGVGGDEKSETLALAEGTLSNSDNESDSEQDGHEKDILTDSPCSSDLEESDDDKEEGANTGENGGKKVRVAVAEEASGESWRKSTITSSNAGNSNNKNRHTNAAEDDDDDDDQDVDDKNEIIDEVGVENDSDDGIEQSK